MSDDYKRALHGCIGCVGGIYCTHDRPRPGSSAGAKRLRKAKAQSRRLARRRAKREGGR